MEKLSKKNSIDRRLNLRRKIEPNQYDHIINMRENKEILKKDYLQKFTPNVFPESYYLKSYDNKHRRTYSIRTFSTNSSIMNASNKILRFLK